MRPGPSCVVVLLVLLETAMAQDAPLLTGAADAGDREGAQVSKGQQEQQLLGQKIRLVEMLLARADKSAAATRPASGDTIMQIRGLLEQARIASGNNEMAAATVSVNTALEQASALARASKQSPSAAEQRSAYQERLAGVMAFRSAFADVVEEKGAVARSELDINAVDQAVTRAEREVSEGRYREANDILQLVYDQVSVALARVRANETLEHRLVFDTPQDEFRYEQERYRSHRMLYDMAMLERNPGPEARNYMEAELGRSRDLLQTAGTQSAAGHYRAAIKTQEAATRHLVNALRRAGLFLP